MVKIFSRIFICILVLLVLASILAFDTFYIEPNILLTNTKKLYIPNWHKDLNGFKIALVTDIHLGTKYVDMKKLKRIVKNINSQKPDIIIICGDLDAKSVSLSNYSSKEIANVLKGFKAEYGVFAVMGNHDYEPIKIVRKIYKDANIPILDNQYKTVEVNNQKIVVFGLKDFWHYKVNPSKVLANCDKTLPTIVLSHNPDTFVQMPNFVSLTLSGHTHGGEIVFPFIGSCIVPSNYGNRYRFGYIVENNKHLFVSRGVATLGYGRFLSPSEINILKLYAQKEKAKDTRPIGGLSQNHTPEVLKFFKKISENLKYVLLLLLKFLSFCFEKIKLF